MLLEAKCLTQQHSQVTVTGWRLDTADGLCSSFLSEWDNNGFRWVEGSAYSVGPGKCVLQGSLHWAGTFGSCLADGGVIREQVNISVLVAFRGTG